jgi:hypothetical protein
VTERATEAIPGNRTDATIWAGILVPPLAWASDELAGLILPDWVCDTGHRWVLQAITAAALLVAAGTGWLAWRAFRADDGSADGPDVANRRQFMAVLAALLSGFFSLVILAGAVPGLVHRPCD